MSNMIFVNLPVSDLKKSMALYEAFGAVSNPQFTHDSAAYMVFSEAIHMSCTAYNAAYILRALLNH